MKSNSIFRSVIACIMVIAMFSLGTTGFASSPQSDKVLPSKLKATDIYKAVYEKPLTAEGDIALNDLLLSLNALKTSIVSSSNVTFSEGKSNRQETKVSGYSGKVVLKGGVTAWEGKPVKTQIQFYNKDSLVKTISYSNFSYSKSDSKSAEFITPADVFDELRITVQVVTDQQLDKDCDAVDVLYKDSSESQQIINEIASGYGFSAGTYGNKADGPSYYEKDLIDGVWRAAVNGVSVYSNGDVFRPRSGIYELGSATAYPLEIKWSSYTSLYPKYKIKLPPAPTTPAPNASTNGSTPAVVVKPEPPVIDRVIVELPTATLKGDLVVVYIYNSSQRVTRILVIMP